MTKVTGELISIDDSAYDGFNGMTIYGNTVQNLWVNPSGTSNGVTVTANDDGSVTVSGTADSGSYIPSPRVYSLRPGSTYRLSVDRAVANARGFYLDFYNESNTSVQVVYVGGSQNNKLSRTFTVDEDADYVLCGFGIDVGQTVSGTYRVMLNEGSTAEPWCPPGLNSVDELSIVTAGKNLLSNTFSGIAYAGGAGVSSGIMRIPEPLMGETVTVSVYKDGSPYESAGNQWALYMGRGPQGEATNEMVALVPTGRTGVVPFVPGGTFMFYANTAFSPGPCTIDVMLELGSTATDYEPPNVTTTPIDLQGHTLNSLPDGTRDELHIDGGGNVVLEKRVGSVTLSSDTSDWEMQSTTGIRYRTGINPPASNVYTPGSVISDALPYRVYSDDPYADTHIIASGYGAYVTVGIDETAQDVADVCGGKKLLYTLATPQTIQLGKISLPKLRKKPLVNNILASGTASGTGFSLAPEIDYEYNQWSTYCDGFRTHGKHSYFDMGCCIAARDTGTPEKKSVTATVPYMSGFYDLSKLYGAIAFEARELMYRFEFVEDSRDELQQRKSQFLEWLSQVHDEEIADDDIPGRHFIGSLSEWEFEEGEEGQSGSLEVTFNCQPFLEADEDTTKTCKAGSNTVTVKGQAVNAYAKTSSGTATIRIGGVTQSVGTTEIRLSVQLQPGDNAVTITGSPVTLRWKELTV